MPYTLLDIQTHRRVEKYAEATGMSVRAAMKTAINEWMDIIGEPVMTLIDERTVEDYAGAVENGRRKTKRKANKRVLQFGQAHMTQKAQKKDKSDQESPPGT